MQYQRANPNFTQYIWTKHEQDIFIWCQRQQLSVRLEYTQNILSVYNSNDAMIVI